MSKSDEIMSKSDEIMSKSEAFEVSCRYKFRMCFGTHLAAHNSLDTVRNDISRLEGETHAISAH